jgi:enoyl-CoA hydratase
VTETAPTATDQPAHDPLVETGLPARGPDGPVHGVALVTIRRPDVLNALSFDLLDAIADAFSRLDADPECRVIVLTGSGDRAFAAGADIRELGRETSISLLVEDRFAVWDRIGAVRKPVIAAVRGFALGGGCELALACDLIVASEDAQFGQPEITIGVMPGAGGTQRLPRAIGKTRAMELVLTGRPITATEAEAMGMVNRVVPPEALLAEAFGLAAVIGAQPPVAVLAAKEAVKMAEELPLSAGLRHERRAFFALFATEDQTEGMAAFAEKRRPAWKGR